MKRIALLILLFASVSAKSQSFYMAYLDGFNGGVLYNVIADTNAFNWTGMTYVVIFKIDPTLSSPYYQWDGWDAPLAHQQTVIRVAHRNNVKVLLCIGGVTGTWYLPTRDSVTCQTIVSAIGAYARSVGYDGLTLDWESQVEINGFKLLSRILRRECDLFPTGRLLTAAIGRSVSNAYDIYHMNTYYDYLEIMAYDGNGYWSSRNAFHEPLHDASSQYPGGLGHEHPTSTMEYGSNTWFNAGLQKSKTCLIFSTYIRAWTYPKNVWQPGMTPTSAGWEGIEWYQTAISQIQSGIFTVAYDTLAAMTWAGQHSNTGYYWYMNYNSPQSITQKVQYVIDNNIGGVGMFTIDQGRIVVNGVSTWPLMEAARLAQNPSAPVITSQPSNTSIYVGGTGTFSVTASGTSPAYQWQLNTVNISGATGSSYTTPTAVIGDNGKSFRCVISNTLGTVTSNSATLTVTNAAPSITTQPNSQTVSVGQTATFTVAATGSQPFSYQWQKASVNIGGATSASYTTPAAVIGDNGSVFRCIVSNAVGSSTSSSATLSVLQSVPFVGDDFSSGSLNTSLWTYTNPSPTSTMSFSGVGTHDALITIAVPAGSEHDLNSGGITSPRVTQNVSNIDNFGLELKGQSLQPTVNYTFWGILVTNSSNDYIRAGMAFDTYGVHPYVQSKVGTTVTRRDPNGSPITNTTRYWIRLTRAGDVWTAYYSTDSLAYVNICSFTQTFTVEKIGFTVANAVGGSSPAITQSIDYMSNMASPLTNEDPTTGTPPAITVQPTPQSANPGATATFTMNTTGSPAPSYQWQKNRVNIGGGTSQNYTTPAVDYSADNGALFRCIVSNSAGTVISNEVALTVNVAPIITVHPVPIIIDSNQVAVFSVSNNAAVPSPSYQWQNNSVNISLATNSTYSFTVAPTDSGHLFRCVISNAAGTVTSNTALLKVNRTAPNILTDPSNISVGEGQTATFVVTSSGKVPISFQWQKNGSDISGATNQSYTTPATSLSDNGATYRCYAFSGYGSDTSGSATLTVTATPPPPEAPTITTQPTNQSVKVGETATFAVGATGTATLAFQWQKNTISVSGATSASYITPATVIGDSNSTFRCIVSNATGTVTSNSATLTVTSPVDTTGRYIQIVYPNDGVALVGGALSHITVNIFGQSQQVTAVMLPNLQALGSYPAIPGQSGNVVSSTIVGGIQAVIYYYVPYDSGNHQIVVYEGTVSDTSATFHVTNPEGPSILIVSDPINLTTGVRGKIGFMITSNHADSMKVLYRRDTDADFKSISYNRNIKLIPVFDDAMVSIWREGYMTAYPYSRRVYLRVYAWKNGVETYVELVVEIA